MSLTRREVLKRGFLALPIVSAVAAGGKASVELDEDFHSPGDIKHATNISSFTMDDPLYAKLYLSSEGTCDPRGFITVRGFNIDFTQPYWTMQGQNGSFEYYFGGVTQGTFTFRELEGPLPLMKEFILETRLPETRSLYLEVCSRDGFIVPYRFILKKSVLTGVGEIEWKNNGYPGIPEPMITARSSNVSGIFTEMQPKKDKS